MLCSWPHRANETRCSPCPDKSITSMVLHSHAAIIQHSDALNQRQMHQVTDYHNFKGLKAIMELWESIILTHYLQHSLGQGSLLQKSLWTSLPSHLLPPYCGTGSEQSLVLCLAPPPHDTVQAPQLAQGAHLPSTGSKKTTHVLCCYLKTSRSSTGHG